MVFKQVPRLVARRDDKTTSNLVMIEAFAQSSI